MPKRRYTPDGQVYDFPDDATEEEIDSFLKGESSVQTSGRSVTDVAVDALPYIGGTVGGILGGLTGLPALGIGAGPGAVIGAGTLGAGGEAAKQLINRARGKPVPGTPGEAAVPIAGQAVLQGGAELAGMGVQAGLRAGGREVYRGILKPSLTKAGIAKGDRIVQTGLKERLPITDAGQLRAERLATELRQEVERAVEHASARGETISLPALGRRLRAWVINTYDKPGLPREQLAAAMRVVDDVLEHPSARVGLGEIPLTDAQGIKTDLGKTISDAEFGVAGTSAQKATQKVLRSSLREGIERGVTASGVTVRGGQGIGPLNAREGRLIEAGKAIARAVARESNQNPLKNVNTWLALTAGGGALAGSGSPYHAAAAALATKLALNPAVASRAAIVAHRLGQTSGATPATVARAAILAVTSGEADDLEKDGEP